MNKIMKGFPVLASRKCCPSQGCRWSRGRNIYKDTAYIHSPDLIIFVIYDNIFINRLKKLSNFRVFALCHKH